MDKLKVAVICHVSNAEIRQNLDLESWTLKRLIKPKFKRIMQQE